jgi:glycosyltransferase involved in cell wall biosynthesis
VQRSTVHLHTDEGNARLTVLMGRFWRGLGRRFALTVHSFRERPDLQHLDRSLQHVYRKARLIVAISEDVRAALTERLHLDPSRIRVISSALPISRWERSQPIPDSVPKAWLDAPVRIIANAGRVVRYEGQDLYGIDTLLDAFAALDQPRASLLVVLGEVVDADLYREIAVKVSADTRVHLISRLESPLAPITHAATVVVRPTRTEGGESLTLTEAIECGVWAVGSDAVRRPEGTELFRTGDAHHLREVLAAVAARSHKPEPRTLRAHVVGQLLEAYRETGLLASGAGR